MLIQPAPPTPTIVDPDGDDANPDTTIEADDVTWQWSRSSTRTGSYSDIAGAAALAVPYTYTPDSTDESMYLRVTATYEDGEGEGKTVMATSVYPVRAVPEPATALLRSRRTLIPRRT